VIVTCRPPARTYSASIVQRSDAATSGSGHGGTQRRHGGCVRQVGRRCARRRCRDTSSSAPRVVAGRECYGLAGRRRSPTELKAWDDAERRRYEAGNDSMREGNARASGNCGGVRAAAPLLRDGIARVDVFRSRTEINSEPVRRRFGPTEGSRGASVRRTNGQNRNARRGRYHRVARLHSSTQLIPAMCG